MIMATQEKNVVMMKKEGANLVITYPITTYDNILDPPASFPPSSHTHDDRYFTETEIEAKLKTKSDSTHKHVKADITDFPASMPASDVSAWAKAATKPGYTKAEVGLANVTNDAQVKRVEIAAANGVASLDASGKVPASQLPSYVDDVLEYASKAGFPASGETGKIYVDTTTNLTFRWSGSAYVEISQSLALGETSSTAYGGDKGKAVKDTVDKILNGTTKVPKAATADTASDVPAWAKAASKPAYTKAEVGLGSVPNVTTNEQAPTYTDTTTLSTLQSGEIMAFAFSKIKLAITNLINHLANKSNPHAVTKAQVGLGNVDDTPDASKPISNSVQAALNSKEAAFAKNTGFNKAFGTGAGTVCQGNDARLSNARTPTAHTHPYTDLTGDSPLSNPNSLINGDFRVNQRGLTTYTASGNPVYTVDRFFILWGNLTVLSNGIKIAPTNPNGGTGYLQQYLELDLTNREVSLQIKELNGSVYSVQGVMNKINTLTIQLRAGIALTLMFDTSKNYYKVNLNTTSELSVEWIKVGLEKIATLCVPRPYAEELALCQRYFNRYDGLNMMVFQSWFSTLRDALVMSIPMPTTPRTDTPTVTVFDCNATDTTSGAIIAFDRLNCSLYKIANNVVSIKIARKDGTVWNAGAVCNSNIKLNIDAEIY